MRNFYLVESPPGEVMKNRRTAYLIYDGDCPFCSRYARMLRLRDSINLQLLDARSYNSAGAASELQEVVSRGFDLDEGMVLMLGDEFYHGEHCIHILATLSSSVSWVNRCFAAVFRSRRTARALYPLLRFFRNLTLRCLGRDKLDLSS